MDYMAFTRPCAVWAVQSSVLQEKEGQGEWEAVGAIHLKSWSTSRPLNMYFIYSRLLFPSSPAYSFLLNGFSTIPEHAQNKQVGGQEQNS